MEETPQTLHRQEERLAPSVSLHYQEVRRDYQVYQAGNGNYEGNDAVSGVYQGHRVAQ